MKMKHVIGNASLTGFAGLLLTFCAVAFQNDLQARVDLKKLDQASNTIAFADIQDCIARGFEKAACETSGKRADLIAPQIFSAYKSEQDCLKYQFACTKHSENKDMDGLGNVQQHTYYTVKRYGWQTLENDLKVVAPLWKSILPDISIRTDGKLVKLNPKYIRN
jgi:hypothetical protein